MENSKYSDEYERSKMINSIIRVTGTPLHSNTDEKRMNNEIEEINANSIETFTLEEFRVLILESRRKGIDFIMARVTTEDPNDPSLVYNFYYAASEFNRILYRSDEDKHLLHMMKVRNPLNNMDLIGHVYYYKISTDQVDISLDNYYNDQIKNNNDQLEKNNDQIKNNNDQIKNNNDHQDILNNFLDDVDNQISNACKDTNDKIIYYANFFASDDNFLRQNEVREYFKINRFEIKDEFLFKLEIQSSNSLELGNYPLNEESTEEGLTWKRALTYYVSILIILIGVYLLFDEDSRIKSFVFDIFVLLVVPLIIIFFFTLIGFGAYFFYYLKNLIF